MAAGTGGGDGPEISIDVSDLRSVLTAAKEYDPALARALRKRLRGTGDEIIAEQRAILSGPLPGLAVKTGKKRVWVTPRDGRRGYWRNVNLYEKSQDAKRSRSTGMRERIKASLKTRVVAGKTRQGVNVRTDVRTAGVMAVQWQAARFRHPVFNTGTFVEQRGQQYFWGPAIRGRERAHQQIEQALAEAAAEIGD